MSGSPATGLILKMQLALAHPRHRIISITWQNMLSISIAPHDASVPHEVANMVDDLIILRRNWLRV